MRHRRNLIASALAVMLAGTGVAAEEPQLDPLTGLKMAGDWEVVRNNCTACHSPRLITQQSGNKAQWLSMIRWMQKKQNLWQFDPAIEEKIISYLADNYPPQADRRRAPIPPDLMPPNPYAPVTVEIK
jgi:mono/diheme cytochrome c family protein